MFNLFRKDPLRKLQKEHASLLAEAHRLSTVNRAESDALMAKAAEIDAKIAELQNNSNA